MSARLNPIVRLRRWRETRLRRRDVRVLDALVATGQPTTVLDLWRATKLSSGAVHIALIRLERDGAVTSEWEPLPEGVRRPRRRLYRVAGGTS